MKKTENQLQVANVDADNLAEQLGITPDRRKEIQKNVDNFVKEEMEKADGGPANVIARIWNEFDNNAECAYCLYILNHEEDKVAIGNLFSLPESVEA